MRAFPFLWAMIAIAGSASAEDDRPTPEGPSTPGYNERLNQVLGSEGGVQVYMDAEGNVGTIIDVPGGERKFQVQPPQSPAMNLGPPLQLPQRNFAPGPAPGPQPPAMPQFPRKADQIPGPTSSQPSGTGSPAQAPRP